MSIFLRFPYLEVKRECLTLNLWKIGKKYFETQPQVISSTLFVCQTEVRIYWKTNKKLFFKGPKRWREEALKSRMIRMRPPPQALLKLNLTSFWEKKYYWRKWRQPSCHSLVKLETLSKIEDKCGIHTRHCNIFCLFTFLSTCLR